MQVSTHSTYFILTTFTVRGQVLNMAGWKPSPVTPAAGPEPDRLKGFKPPLLLQFLNKSRQAAGVFSWYLLRKPQKKEDNLPELVLSWLRLSNLAYKSDGTVHLLLCCNRLKGALHSNLHWLYALIEEVLLFFGSCSVMTNRQFSSLGLPWEGQKILSATSRTFICTGSSAQICSTCYPPVCMASVWLGTGIAKLPLKASYVSAAETCQQTLQQRSFYLIHAGYLPNTPAKIPEL